MGIASRCSPREEEKIMVFAASGSIKVGDFVSDCKLSADSSIRKVEVRHGYANLDSTSRLFGMVYSLCDFYIFPESWVDRVQPGAAIFSKTTINELIPNSTPLNLLSYETDTYYGIQIYDKDSKNGVMTSYISYSEENPEENYYIIFRKDSYHIGGLNHNPSNNAIRIVNYLLSKA